MSDLGNGEHWINNSCSLSGKACQPDPLGLLSSQLEEADIRRTNGDGGQSCRSVLPAGPLAVERLPVFASRFSLDGSVRGTKPRERGQGHGLPSSRAILLGMVLPWSLCNCRRYCRVITQPGTET